MLPFDITAAENISGIPPASRSDHNLDKVYQWFSSQSDFKDRFGQALRQSIDEVLDGQRTGRFNIDDLEKTEKTYLGTKVEIVARAAFNLKYGQAMDYTVAGHDVDSKFTILKNWTIPGEAIGHICLLMKANDHESRFQVGLLHIEDNLLNSGQNRDGKRSLSALGRSSIRWLVRDGELPKNILLNLPEADRSAIFQASSKYHGRGNGGQSRTDELFRRVQKQLVDRNTVLTVASQEDSPKRVRDSRKRLRHEGIIILGHQGRHPHIARALRLPIPGKGSWVAARITVRNTPAEARPIASIDNTNYALWTEGDTDDPAPANY